MQIDIGFGDAIIGADPEVELPTILDYPAPRLSGYSRESAIAEKLSAMFQHGRLNSRMKDYFDIGMLARHFAFEGAVLAQAIEATFQRRGIQLDDDPIGLRDEFALQPGKQAQWASFQRKLRVREAPEHLLDQVTEIRRFLQPVLSALMTGSPLHSRWPGSGPWTTSNP